MIVRYSFHPANDAYLRQICLDELPERLCDRRKHWDSSGSNSTRQSRSSLHHLSSRSESTRRPDVRKKSENVETTVACLLRRKRAAKNRRKNNNDSKSA